MPRYYHVDLKMTYMTRYIALFSSQQFCSDVLSGCRYIAKLPESGTGHLVYGSS